MGSMSYPDHGMVQLMPQAPYIPEETRVLIHRGQARSLQVRSVYLDSWTYVPWGPNTVSSLEPAYFPSPPYIHFVWTHSPVQCPCKHYPLKDSYPHSCSSCLDTLNFLHISSPGALWVITSPAEGNFRRCVPWVTSLACAVLDCSDICFPA